jgi:hypothetical protein
MRAMGPVFQARKNAINGQQAIRFPRPKTCRALLEDADRGRSHWIELLTEEKTLFAPDPIIRIVPTTTARMTASITAYSATS